MSMKLLFLLAACTGLLPVFGEEGPKRTLELPPGPGNPRNSEGSFVTLTNGNVLFIYSRFTGKSAGDDGSAVLASRISADGGRSWSDLDEVAVSREGKKNVMSVSLLRLASGKIALFYLRKDSDADCRPVMRVSADEGRTWGKPSFCVGERDASYYVLNNDRAVQLASGRLVLPLAWHSWKSAALAVCALSDDEGKTWRLGKRLAPLPGPGGRAVDEQEPGVVELRDGRLLMFIRNELGSIAFSYSADGGETWGRPALSGLKAPLAPASIKHLPDGGLLLVWNDHGDVPPELLSKRVPLSTAVSRDEGKTWIHRRVLENDPKGWYCYIAIHPVGDAVLLGYCSQGLNSLRVTRVPLGWLGGAGE